MAIVIDTNACFRGEVQSVLKLRIEGSFYRRNRGRFVDAPSQKLTSALLQSAVREALPRMSLIRGIGSEEKPLNRRDSPTPHRFQPFQRLDDGRIWLICRDKGRFVQIQD